MIVVKVYWLSGRRNVLSFTKLSSLGMDDKFVTSYVMTIELSFCCMTFQSSSEQYHQFYQWPLYKWFRHPVHNQSHPTFPFTFAMDESKLSALGYRNKFLFEKCYKIVYYMIFHYTFYLNMRRYARIRAPAPVMVPAMFIRVSIDNQCTLIKRKIGPCQLW